MTTAKKRIAHKITLEVDEAGGVNFTKLCNIKIVTDPSLSREVVNVDCQDTEIEENRPGPVLQIGDLGIEIFWDEADVDHQRLVTMITGAQPETRDDDPSWRMTFPFATPIQKIFRGWLMELGEGTYEVKNEVMKSAKVKVTHVPVISP